MPLEDSNQKYHTPDDPTGVGPPFLAALAFCLFRSRSTPPSVLKDTNLEGAALMKIAGRRFCLKEGLRRLESSGGLLSRRPTLFGCSRFLPLSFSVYPSFLPQGTQSRGGCFDEDCRKKGLLEGGPLNRALACLEKS